MTLTTRLTLFAMAALAGVLAAFSTAVFLLGRAHLNRQVNDRATATLDTLVAAAEVEADGLDWEPADRRVRLRGDGQPPAWAVFDEAGRRVDGSPDPAPPLDAYAAPGDDGEQERGTITWDGGPWRVYRHTLRATDPEAVRGTPENPRYRVLVFVTACPLAPVHDLLRALGLVLAGVAVAVCLLAAAVAWFVCRRALAPVGRMTAAAAGITAADPGERLPVPAARDELHHLAVAFNALLARLHDALERQRRFAGEASHQLRTPVAAMLGQMEVALRRDREPAEYRRALAAAVAQAERLRQIVEALLFLARADAEAELPGTEVIDLGAWAGEFLAVHPFDRREDVRFTAAAGVQAAVPPGLFAQAFGNLLDNAAKYSAPGSPITVTVEADGGEGVLVVADAGHGIDPTDLGRVFEPFFRSADARRRGVGGAGLGLAVADRVVRAVGGRVEVTSAPGVGSRFVVRLPLRPAEQDIENEPVPLPKHSG